MAIGSVFEEQEVVAEEVVIGGVWFGLDGQDDVSLSEVFEGVFNAAFSDLAFSGDGVMFGIAAASGGVAEVGEAGGDLELGWCEFCCE